MTMVFAYVTLYVLLALLVTLMARFKRAAHGVGYLSLFVLALAFTPLPMFIFLLILPPREKATRGQP